MSARGLSWCDVYTAFCDPLWNVVIGCMLVCDTRIQELIASFPAAQGSWFCFVFQWFLKDSG